MIIGIFKRLAVGGIVFAVLFYLTAYILERDVLALFVLAGFVFYLAFTFFIPPAEGSSQSDSGSQYVDRI